MERKHIKLFEESAYPTIEESKTFNVIYETWKNTLPEGWMYMSINEQAEWLDDEDHTKGERAAISRGDQLQSKEQLSALYLFALGKIEGVGADYLRMIDGLADFGYINDDDRAFSITVPALADAIGLESEGTVSRTVTKFMRIIDGIGDTHAERIYPKLVKAFEFLSKRNPTEIAEIASGAMQDPETSTRHRDHAEARLDTAADDRKQKQMDNEGTGKAIFGLIKSLIGPFGIAKALPMALSKISGETGVDSTKLKSIYREYLRKNKILGSQYYV